MANNRIWNPPKLTQSLQKQILQNIYLDWKDIGTLEQCSMSDAKKIMRTLTNEALERGKKYPYQMVFTKDYLDSKENATGGNQ